MTIPHIAIVKHPKGYVAHLRYEDRFKDKDISASTYKGIHAAIDRELASDS